MGPKDAQARGQRGDETVASPLEVTSLFSAYYSDAARFPASSLEFDCALLMRDVPHQWRALPSMYTGGAQDTLAAAQVGHAANARGARGLAFSQRRT